MDRRTWGTGLVEHAAAALRRAFPPRIHPLLAFIHRPDRAYTWSSAGEARLGGGATATRVHLISQVWQGMAWKHELHVIRPGRCRPGAAALLLIAGDRGEHRMLQLAARAAGGLGRPVGVLFDVPNQPLFGGKSEDALIAHSFGEYLRTRDRSWPLLFPMVKSAIRAMDTIQELSSRRWGTAVSQFVVTGASKRGWTTWLTGATDPRVIGIAPMVYDNLNLGAQMTQQLHVYGAYSEQISDYDEADLPQMLATPEGRVLAEMIDPFVLRERLRVPKLLIHGSNDRYWTLESASLYYDELPGDKHVLYVPNCGHGLKELPRVLQALGAFTDACAEGCTLPRLHWRYLEYADSLHLVVTPERSPVGAVAWAATASTRDFRDVRWYPQRMRSTGREYHFTLPRPGNGYAAAFGEVTYRWSGGRYCQSTTPRVIGPT